MDALDGLCWEYGLELCVHVMSGLGCMNGRFHLDWDIELLSRLYFELLHF